MQKHIGQKATRLRLKESGEFEEATATLNHPALDRNI
jgi:hypothetical protein